MTAAIQLVALTHSAFGVLPIELHYSGKLLQSVADSAQSIAIQLKTADRKNLHGGNASRLPGSSRFSKSRNVYQGALRTESKMRMLS